MLSYFAALLLLVLSLVGIVLLRTFFAVPLNELKRQAARHDKLAESLYASAVYETSLRVVLWLLVALTSAAGFVLLARDAPILFGLVAIALVLLLTYVWLPASGLTGFGSRLAIWSSPALSWLLNLIEPSVKKVASPYNSRINTLGHTRLFEAEDLVKMLEKQAAQSDNRIPLEDIEIAKNALVFGSRRVIDVLTPASKVRSVNTSDAITPVLADELHASGHHVFPVKDDTKAVVGLLDLNRLADLSNVKKGGLIQNYMDPVAAYIHEDDSLDDVLDAFFKTKQRLFVIISSNQDFVGIVTLEDAMLCLLGARIGSEFKSYEDKAAVANKKRYAEQANDPQPDLAEETLSIEEETVVE